jgi:hypothetical protein
MRKYVIDKEFIKYTEHIYDENHALIRKITEDKKTIEALQSALTELNAELSEYEYNTFASAISHDEIENPQVVTQSQCCCVIL